MFSSNIKDIKFKVREFTEEQLKEHKKLEINSFCYVCDEEITNTLPKTLLINCTDSSIFTGLSQPINMDIYHVWLEFKDILRKNGKTAIPAPIFCSANCVDYYILISL